MGKKAKEHRKRVLKWVESKKLVQKKFQKLFDEQIKLKLEQLKSSQSGSTTSEINEAN